MTNAGATDPAAALTLVRTCREIDCHRRFEITPEMQQFFLSRGLTLPVRCMRCRLRRKAARAAEGRHV